MPVTEELERFIRSRMKPPQRGRHLASTTRVAPPCTLLARAAPDVTVTALPWFVTELATLPSELLEMLAQRPAWHGDALCREHPEVTWFPGHGERTEPAKALCAQCLVRAECLEWALEHEEFGVWGGLSTRERAAMRPPPLLAP